MFSVPGCLSRKGSWFLGSQAQDRKGTRPCEPGWGACIDVSLPGCDAVRRCRIYKLHSRRVFSDVLPHCFSFQHVGVVP